jgi:CHAT domain-containing protein
MTDLAKYDRVATELVNLIRENPNREEREIIFQFFSEHLNYLDLPLIDAFSKIFSESPIPDLANLYLRLGNRLIDFASGKQAETIEVSIACYQMVLEIYTQTDFPVEWAETQHILANAYSDRIRGDRSENLELAIWCYQAALEVYTKTALPLDWAMTQHILAIAYWNRISGDRAENLELEIAAYQAALEIYTKTALPVDWARTQNNLAVAYINRISGDRAENLELAIVCCQAALEIYTKIDLPLDWARTQYNLAIAYWNRISGDRAENLELEIAAYQAALEIYTKTALPVDWARTQYNLANVYLNRIKGNKTENLEQAIAGYEAALEIRTKENFSLDRAMTQINFGITYTKRIKGDRAENLEQAIAIHTELLEIFIRENFPVEWAMTKHNLGIAYSERIKGNRAENLEQAILCYEAALEIRTKENFPVDWAMIQSDFASVYLYRIKGNRAENLEQAIAGYEAALEIRTKENFPIDWALTQHNLAIAYSGRIEGNRAENLEQAIAGYEAALEITTKENFSLNRAITQIALAATYNDRIEGDRSENLEQAIVCCEAALEICTKEDSPIYWASTKNNIAIAYMERIEGNRAENLEQAIAGYEAALEIRTKENFPIDWALTKNNIANVYLNRIKGNRAENLEQAIAGYEAALEIRTKENFPIQWAMTQNNLAIAYSGRIEGDRAKNIEQDIVCCEVALEIRTKENFPIDWAMTQNNLAAAYSYRIEGDRSQNLEQAIASYQSALEVYSSQNLPVDCLRTANNLGGLHFNEGNWQAAIDAYLLAISAVEQSRTWAITDQNKQETLERAISVYYNLVQSCINTQQYNKALEYAERSKSRNLVDLLANRDTYPRGEIAPEILASLTELRRQVLIAERQIQQQNNRSRQGFMDSDNSQRGIAIPQSVNAIEHSDRLVSLKQELDRLITTHIQPVDPSFQLTQKVEPISFEEMRSALPDDRTALVTWYIAQTKLLTFIVTPQATHPQLIESTLEAFQQFIEVLTEYQTAYSQYRDRLNKDWKTALPQYLAQFSQTLGLAEILQQLPPECDQAILIPHRYLHLIPLHALPIELPDGTETCLLDRFPQGVRYAPSVQLLKLAQQWSRPPLQNLLAVQDPTQDLTFTNLEVTALRTHFQPFDRVFRHQEAQKSALTVELIAQSNCVHFSCHGAFDFANPTQSALMLSESLVTTPDGRKICDLEKCLTLGEIFTQDLRQCRLVTLSACETGIVDVSKQIDEYIGLPSGFLFAGSPSIVSSLWAVDDLSTTCLMIRFYNNLQQNDSVSIALNDAQRWLRQANGKEIKEMVTPWLAQSGIRPSRVMEIDAQLDRIEKESEPFAAPYHWAAFCAIGQ